VGVPVGTEAGRLASMRRGNPNWGKDSPAKAAPVCAFDLKVSELGLTADQYIHSAELRAWAAAHKNTKYIPESLLKVWGLVPNTSF
jgi:hypothetical protein